MQSSNITSYSDSKFKKKCVFTCAYVNKAKPTYGTVSVFAELHKPNIYASCQFVRNTSSQLDIWTNTKSPITHVPMTDACFCKYVFKFEWDRFYLISPNVRSHVWQIFSKISWPVHHMFILCWNATSNNMCDIVYSYEF